MHTTLINPHFVTYQMMNTGIAGLFIRFSELINIRNWVLYIYKTCERCDVYKITKFETDVMLLYNELAIFSLERLQNLVYESMTD